MKPILVQINALLICVGSLLCAGATAEEGRMLAFSGKSATEGKFVADANGIAGVVRVFEESGVASGFAAAQPEHKLHCFGILESVGAISRDVGYCEETDGDGDRIVWRLQLDAHSATVSSSHGMSEAIDGTGKFAGVKGWLEFNCTPSGLLSGYKNECENKGVLTLVK